MHFSEKTVGGRRYRIASQAVWDTASQRPYSRQVVLGPAEPAPTVDLAATRTVGTMRLGDVGALAWVAEQLDVVRIIDTACGARVGPQTASIGELVLGVAIQRACDPGAKRDLGTFLDSSVARISCLPGKAFSGPAFVRAAAKVTDVELEQAQIALARAAVARFGLAADVLAFDTTNFDTHIDTRTRSKLPQRGHAKSKRKDLRVVGLAVLVSETGHVPLLHRTYPGNAADQSVLNQCLDGLRELHVALDDAEDRKRPSARTLVRDGGSWGEQLELDLNIEGYGTIVSLPLGHGASQRALDKAAKRGAMKPLRGKLAGVRAARMIDEVGSLKRTLVVVSSDELLAGQKRGIARALKSAQAELAKLERRCNEGKSKLDRATLERRVQKALAREHLAHFVVTEISGTNDAPKLTWSVDAARRRELERTRLGKRVLCTDRHAWGTERIVAGFRGQWNVEELFRRAKHGGVVPWGPSFQRVDPSLRLHTFATVLGLMLVSLARLHLGTRTSARGMMEELAQIDVTLVRTTTGARGRQPTHHLAPELTPTQARAVKAFDLGRWMPSILSARTSRSPRRETARAA